MGPCQENASWAHGPPNPSLVTRNAKRQDAHAVNLVHRLLGGDLAQPMHQVAKLRLEIHQEVRFGEDGWSGIGDGLDSYAIGVASARVNLPPASLTELPRSIDRPQHGFFLLAPGSPIVAFTTNGAGGRGC